MAKTKPSVLRCLAVLGVFVVILHVKPCMGQHRLGCFARQYLNYDAEKPGCRPQRITIYGCFGRCHTSEIPMLLPPYKKSSHSMCSYDQTEERMILLDDCDPGVDPTFVYYDAVSCICKKCEPWNTHCQGI